MSIQDRDYMKKPSRSGGGRSAPLDERVEAFVGTFLARHPRFLLYLSIGAGILFVAAIMGSKLR